MLGIRGAGALTLAVVLSSVVVQDGAAGAAGAARVASPAGAVAVASAAGPTPDPPSPGVSVILPPGQDGFASPQAFAQNQIDGNCADYGPHYCDRLGDYLAWRWDVDELRRTADPQPGDQVEVLQGGQVRILRDAATGSPHVFANPSPGTSGDTSTRSGLWNVGYGAGVAVAEDRLFQMEAFRRAAEGTLSDLLGPSMLRYDEEYRRDTETDAERAADVASHLSPDQLAGLDGYVAGVNAVIQRDTADPVLMPAEFPLLQDLPIRPWTREDCLAIGTLEIKAEAEAGGQEFSTAADLQRLAAAGLGTAGAAGLLQDWYFREDPSTPVSIAAVDAAGPAPDVYPFTANDTLARLSALPPDLSAFPEAGVDTGMSGPGTALLHAHDVVRTIVALGLPRFGSNAVAIAPSHTSFGGALLYGGPQAGYSVPAVFTRLELHAPGIAVGGAAVAGAGPLVVIGHTPDHAWTITTGQDDQVDTYVERVRKDPNDPTGDRIQVLVRGVWQPVEMRIETYRYRALNSPLPPVSSVTPPVYRTATATVYRTRHSGIPSPIIALRWDAGGRTGWAISKTRAFWNTAAQTGAAIQGLTEATSVGQFDAAARQVPIAFNFIYADRAGHIGYWHTGAVPLRAAGHDPRLPAPGDGSMEWQGMLPPTQWPSVVDPTPGFVASWNNRAALNFPDSGDGTVWGPGQRVAAVQHAVSARLAQGPIDAAGLSKVMEAVGSEHIPALQFFQKLLLRLEQPGAPSLSPAAQRALAAVASWDGNVYYPYGATATTVRQPGATVFSHWLAHLEDAVLRHVFAPMGPTPWNVGAWDDATTGPASGGRTEFFDNFTPVVIHALEPQPSVPRHLDWLPAAGAPGQSYQQRVDQLSAAALEQAVTELTGPAPNGFGTSDQSRWLDPTAQTAYMSESAGSVPNQPFENRGVFGLLAAFPAPVATATSAPSAVMTQERPATGSRPEILPATGRRPPLWPVGVLLIVAGVLWRGSRAHQRRRRRISA